MTTIAAKASVIQLALILDKKALFIPKSLSKGSIKRQGTNTRANRQN